MSETPAAIEAALKLLSIRARSRKELTQSLLRRGFSSDEAEEAVIKVAEWGYLDDVAFAAARARKLLEGRFGAQVVLRRLLADGISRRDAEAAIREVASAQAIDPRAVAAKLLEARKIDLRDQKGRARAARLLGTRGFSAEVILGLTGLEMLDPVGDPE